MSDIRVSWNRTFHDTVSFSMRFFSALILALVLAACGGGDTDAPPVDSTDAADAVDSMRDAPPDTARPDADSEFTAEPSSDAEGSSGSRQDPDAQPHPGGRDGLDADDSPTDQDTGAPQLAARYRLAYVDGEAMPVTIDENADCRVDLVDGDLRIRADRSFELRASSRTTCGGELINDDVMTATGTVDRQGDRLRFEATRDEFFATATGTFTPSGHINVDRLELGGDMTPVDWRFQR